MRAPQRDPCYTAKLTIKLETNKSSIPTLSIRVLPFIMKTLKLFAFLCLIAFVRSKDDWDMDKVALPAIVAILKDYFVSKTPKVDLCFLGPKSEILAEKVLKGAPSGLSIRVLSYIKIPKNDMRHIDFPSIFLFDSGEHFHEASKKIYWESALGLAPNHIIYAPKRNYRDLIFENELANNGIENQNFIRVLNRTTADLVTGFQFSPGRCTFKYESINQFSVTSMKWAKDIYFPEKYQNFHGCELKIFRYQSYYTPITDHIYSTLALRLNYRRSLYSSKIFSKKTAEDFDMVEAASFQDFTEYNTFYLEYSGAVYDDFLTFTVPAGEPYKEFEKMFLMFDKATWICIGVTLAGALVVIQIINLLTVKVKKFVFGRDITTPSLNVASIFLTGSQFNSPGRNFARFILMLFIWWTLMIRTCYQSELFKYLQGDSRKPIISSIDELNEKNFTLFYDDGQKNFEEVINKR